MFLISSNWSWNIKYSSDRDINIIFAFNYSTTLVNDGQEVVNILQSLTEVSGFLVVQYPAKSSSKSTSAWRLEVAKEKHFIYNAFKIAWLTH